MKTPADLAAIRRSLTVARGRFVAVAQRARQDGRPSEAAWADRHAANLETARRLLGGRVRQS